MQAETAAGRCNGKAWEMASSLDSAAGFRSLVPDSSIACATDPATSPASVTTGDLRAVRPLHDPREVASWPKILQ
jgi:hypothetical protein